MNSGWTKMVVQQACLSQMIQCNRLNSATDSDWGRQSDWINIQNIFSLSFIELYEGVGGGGLNVKDLDTDLTNLVMENTII